MHDLCLFDTVAGEEKIVYRFRARPVAAELFADPPKIANGRLRLKEAPGLGLALSDAALKKYGERIV
jgi:L-alanine-DL-glutamate epimerase-like enolase superfamily enzyme